MVYVNVHKKLLSGKYLNMEIVSRQPYLNVQNDHGSRTMIGKIIYKLWSAKYLGFISADSHTILIIEIKLKECIVRSLATELTSIILKI